MGKFKNLTIIEQDDFDLSAFNDLYKDWLKPMNKENPILPTYSDSCECGSDSTYGPENKNHSNWCPKHE